MEPEKDDVSGETMPEVYRQFICYQEKVNKRFQELEDLIGLAAQKMEILKKRNAQRKMAVKCVNPFAKTMTICNQEEIHESLHHLLSFPKFVEGSGVSEWLKDCEQYFSVFEVEENKKVAIAGMQMQGTARKWFQVYTEENNNFVWSEFCKQFIAKFGNWDRELYDNFKQLQQDTATKLKELPDELKEFPDLQMKSKQFKEPTNASLETHIKEPVFNEEPGKWPEFGPEQEFILAALVGGNLNSPNLLQSVICSSGRSEELVEFSNIEDLQQKNVSPGDNNNCAYSVLQPSREVTYLEMSAVDPYIFQSLGISTANCITDLGNSLTWSTGDKDMPSVGNNSIGEFEFNGLFPLFDEKGTYNDLRKPLEPSMPTNEAVHDLKLVLMAENAIFLELNDPSRPLCCPFEAGQIEWIQGEEQHLGDEELSSMILANMREMTETLLYKAITSDPLTTTIFCKFGKISSNFSKENVLIFDPGGHVQNKHSKGVKNKVKDMFRSEVKLKVVMKISIGGQLRPWEGSSLNFQAMEQLVKGPFHWQREVVSIEIGNLARLQSQSIQKVSDEFDSIVDEINQQYVYSVGIGMVVIPYMYTVLEPGSLENTRRLEDYVVYRKRVLITIFDPGHKSDAQLVSSIVRILHIQHLLQEVKRSWKCMIHHEDMVAFKEGGMSGLGS